MCIYVFYALCHVAAVFLCNNGRLYAFSQYGTKAIKTFQLAEAAGNAVVLVLQHDVHVINQFCPLGFGAGKYRGILIDAQMPDYAGSIFTAEANPDI